jgi:hypothetical protein
MPRRHDAAQQRHHHTIRGLISVAHSSTLRTSSESEISQDQPEWEQQAAESGEERSSAFKDPLRLHGGRLPYKPSMAFTAYSFAGGQQEAARPGDIAAVHVARIPRALGTDNLPLLYLFMPCSGGLEKVDLVTKSDEYQQQQTLQPGLSLQQKDTAQKQKPESAEADGAGDPFLARAPLQQQLARTSAPHGTGTVMGRARI